MISIEQAREELGSIDNFCTLVCNYCTANDWYCPTDCDVLEKARRLEFDRLVNCYAANDGDLCAVVRYIKRTKEQRIRGGY